MKYPAEGGYVVLLMMVVLLGVGVSWTGVSVHGKVAYSGLGSLSDSDARSLLNARQSLISYAALYPFLYGPTSAGPSHLPCPDTDGLQSSQSASYLTAPNHSRDGPNPPCAPLNESDGRLPRHIVLPGHRYLFHSAFWQRFDYRVAGDMINNPINRVVNLQTLALSGPRLLASISLRPTLDHTINGRVTINAIALRDVVAASVAAWVMARASDTTSDFCSASSNDPCYLEHEGHSACQSDRLLIHVLDMPLMFPKGACLIDDIDDRGIEGVSATRHWFIRNRWHEWVQVTHGEGCDPAKIMRNGCKLVYPLHQRKRVASGSNVIKLQWVMPS